MKIKLLELLNLTEETEKPESVIERIKKDSAFKGTNLWILVFAILIASLGLNINSTAVIIGAMLISPLMGPIMGIGMGVATNDLGFVKDAVKNFAFAIAVSLITSTIYFSITPLNDAYSELLARTTPTIYDVLIALFGGLAGILAHSSNQKGNAIPGVAIATALMPPLCTAGYGIATFQFNYFFGAFYLFTINTVFIALATFLTLKFLKYPIRHLSDPKSDKRSMRIITAVTLLTLIPSIYFGYEMIIQNRFVRNANLFIESNTSIEGSYLLNKNIDASKKTITLVFGGNDLAEKQIKKLNEQLEIFGLQNTSLKIKQGISSLVNKKESERVNQLSNLLNQKDRLLREQKIFIDSVSTAKELTIQILRELKISYPEIKSMAIKPFVTSSDTIKNHSSIILAQIARPISRNTKTKIEKWLRIRLNDSQLKFNFFY